VCELREGGWHCYIDITKAGHSPSLFQLQRVAASKSILATTSEEHLLTPTSNLNSRPPPHNTLYRPPPPHLQLSA
jgi:hypothetical protein